MVVSSAMGAAGSGPWFRDALVDVAAGRGVPNLEADVLAANGPMLPVLRARGSVVMSHDGYSIMRLMIGTSGTTPTWPSGPAPCVLVEAPGGRWPSEDDARALGLFAVACPGPSQQHPCPVLNGQRCPLADDARRHRRSLSLRRRRMGRTPRRPSCGWQRHGHRRGHPRTLVWRRHRAVNLGDHRPPPRPSPCPALPPDRLTTNPRRRAVARAKGAAMHTARWQRRHHVSDRPPHPRLPGRRRAHRGARPPHRSRHHVQEPR